MAAHQFLPCATNEIFCKKCGLLTEAVEGTRVPCKELGHSFVSHPKRQSFFCERCGRASDADTSLPCLFPAPSHQNTFHLPEPSKRHLSSDSDDKPTNTKRQKQSSRPPAPSPSPTPSAADEYLSEDGDRDADEDMKSANSSTQLRFAPNVFQDFTTTRWRFSLLGDAVTAAVYDLGTETYETEAAAKASQAALLETFAKLGDRSWENLVDRFAMAFKLRNQQSLRGDVSNGVDKVVIMESPGVSDYYLFAFQTCGPAQLSKNEDYTRLKSAHVTEPTEVQPIMTKLGTHITEKLLPTWSGKLTKTATASFQHSSSTLSSPSHSSSERKVAADAVKASSRFIPMEQLNDESPTVGFMYLALRLPRDTPRGVYFQVHDAVRSAF